MHPQVAPPHPDEVSEYPVPGKTLSPEQIIQCKEGNTQPFTLAGMGLGTPSEPVLARLGEPTKIETSSRFGNLRYHYGFGTVGVDGTQKISDITITDQPPLGELWPGITWGDRRDEVLRRLAELGFCGILQPNGQDVSFPHASHGQLLVLTFSSQGVLVVAGLIQIGP